LESVKGRDYLENQWKNGRIILKYILRKWGGRVCTGLCGSAYEFIVGCCIHSNEPLGSMKCEVLLE
jgi:hypothetical protein